MSEIPPNPDPNQPPPVHYAEYPRGAQGGMYGSADKLLALWEGYSGLNYVFILNIALALGGRVVALAPVWSGSSPEMILVFYGIYFLVLMAAIGACSYPQNKKIGFGKGWPDGNAIVASVLTALFSWLCCGIFGYVVMQQIAANEMKKYGLRVGIGMKKKVVLARVEEIRAQEATMRSPGFNV